MKTGNAVNGNNDVESLEIDIDKILSDDDRDHGVSMKRSQRSQNRHKQRHRAFSQQSPFHEASQRITGPPTDLVIQKTGQDDDISTIMTDMFDGAVEQAKPAAVKHLHNEEGNNSDTDGTIVESITGEPPSENSGVFSERRGSGFSATQYYRSACVLAVMLLSVICGLGFVFDILVESGDDPSTDTRSHDNISKEAVWTLRPTPPPTIRQDTVASPSPTSQTQETRPPTSTVPTRRRSTSPSEAPTFIDSASPTIPKHGHLLDLLVSTTTEKTIEAINIRGSPQQKAYEWLHKDPSYFEYTTTRKLRRFSLAVLYFSTVKSASAYEALETWMDYDTHECSWYTSWYENRLPCGSDGIFRYLSLRNIGLVGTIPSELALLSNLRALVMNDNMLTGSLPEELGEWRSLRTFDLHGNFLSGRIPAWKNVPELQEIDLSLNLLTGPVPSSTGNLNILSLDLTQNSLVGAMPFGLCSLSNQIQVLAADCEEVYCSCCTQCDSDGTRAPVMAPGTPPPTLPPVNLPLTAAPSLLPSKHPTTTPTRVPTKAPTSQPSMAPSRALPTPQPTPDPFCMENIQTSKRCYLAGESINVIYSNCNATITDWIGIYDIEDREDTLFDPLLSHRTCIHEPCSGVQQHTTITLDGSARGSFNWPLLSGRYKVYLFRGGSAVGPYTFLSQSLYITVADHYCG